MGSTYAAAEHSHCQRGCQQRTTASVFDKRSHRKSCSGNRLVLSKVSAEVGSLNKR